MTRNTKSIPRAGPPRPSPAVPADAVTGTSTDQPRTEGEQGGLPRWPFVAACAVAILFGWLVRGRADMPDWPATVLLGVGFVSGGWFAARNAMEQLRIGRLDVDLLMLLAALGAAAVGEPVEGAVLLLLFSASGAMEQAVLGRNLRALSALLRLAPETAHLVRGTETELVRSESLRPGDRIRVRPGERVPADGLIVEGQTFIDSSAVTGESRPVGRSAGDPVLAGTVNQTGVIEVEVTREAGDTVLARIVTLVRHARQRKMSGERYAEWVGRWYTWFVLVVAAIVFAVPAIFLGEPSAVAFYRAMTVLVVASPCAVVLSVPVAAMAALTAAARNGILFKGGIYLERLARLDAVAFDKTGTLTAGCPAVVACRPVDGVSRGELLALAAAVEADSEHPLATAVRAAANAEGITVPVAEAVEALVGRGIRGRIDERTILVGCARLFQESGRSIPAELRSSADDRTATVAYVGDDVAILGLIVVADAARPEAAAAIAQLRRLGIRHLVMLTGDSASAAEAVAAEVDLPFRAELLPEDKLRFIHHLREAPGCVAMVGDGINDAPSLAAADVGISLGRVGTDVALEAADVVLMADDLRALAGAVALARQTRRIVRQNVIFALAVIVVLLSLTLAGSVRLPEAVVGHEGSTVLVILNGLRLLAVRFPKELS